MVQETDTSQEKAWFYKEQARMAIASLNRKNIDAQYAFNRSEALEVIMNMIPEDATVGVGDSVTLYQVGIIPRLRERDRNQIFEPMQRDENGFAVLEGEERLEGARKVLTADIYLTGTNAITLDGKLVNTDGLGNRVAPMIFGPKKVIVVVGINKIERNVEEAQRRIREFSAPIVAKRHLIKHHREYYATLPCVKTGTCVDCNHDYRICHYSVVIDGVRKEERGRINVVVVGEELGI